jgi:LysR family glycine cleavage system transcriptional activator
MGDYPSLVAEKLCDEAVFPVCAPRIAARLSTPADLAREELIHIDGNARFDPSFPDWQAWLAAAGASGVDADRGLRFTLSTPAIEAAIDGQGVLLGRSLVVAEDLAAGRLARPFALELPVRPAYYLVYPRAALRRGTVARLRDWVLAEFARTNPADARADPSGFRELALLGAAD